MQFHIKNILLCSLIISIFTTYQLQSMNFLKYAAHTTRKYVRAGAKPVLTAATLSLCASLISSIIKHSPAGYSHEEIAIASLSGIASIFLLKNYFEKQQPAELFIKEMYALLEDIPYLSSEEFKTRLHLFTLYAKNTEHFEKFMHCGYELLQTDNNISLIDAFSNYHAEDNKSKKNKKYTTARWTVETIERALKISPELITIKSQPNHPD